MLISSSGEKKGNGEDGFTSLEALISLAVFAVIFIAVLQVYDGTQQSYIRGEARVDLQQSVRVALDEIMHDVRLAGYDPSNAINAQTLKYPLQPVTGSALSTTELRLIGDVNNDGTTDCVAFRLVEGQINVRRTDWSAGNCSWSAGEWYVAYNISGMTITYFPATGITATTDPAQARRVRVQITGFSPTYGTTFTQTTEATLRQ